MASEKPGVRRSTLLFGRGGISTVRNERSPTHVVSVLFATGVDEWRRGWKESPGGPPTREAVITANETTRSVAATGTSGSAPVHRIPERGLTYTALGVPVDRGRLLATVSASLADSDAAEPTLLVDDVGALIEDVGAVAAAEVVESLASVVADAGGVSRFGYTLRSGDVETAGRIAAVVEELVDVDPTTDEDVIAAVDRLRREDPTTFGYTRRHWREARRGIETATRNYPQSKQIHAELNAPETTSRTLGAAMSGLVALGVIDTWGETVGSTRYDLTAYDPIRMATIGAALDDTD